MFHPTGETPRESNEPIRAKFEHSPREMHFRPCLIELLNFSLQKLRNKLRRGKPQLRGRSFIVS